MFPFLLFSSVMASTSDASTLSRYGCLPGTPLTLEVYTCKYESCLDTERFDAVLLNGPAETMYHYHNGFDRDTMLGACSL